LPEKANTALLLIGIASVASAQTPPAPLAPLSARLQNERDNAELQKIAPYTAFFFGGSAPAPGVAAARQFLATVRRIEELEQGVQVRLVNHGFSDPPFWDRVDRLARRKPGDPILLWPRRPFSRGFSNLRPKRRGKSRPTRAADSREKGS